MLAMLRKFNLNKLEMWFEITMMHKYGVENLNNHFMSFNTICDATQNVPPAVLLRFLREHRSEWADSGIYAYAAAAVKAARCTIPIARTGCVGGQVILPLAHTIENEEFMEVVRLENLGYYRKDMFMPGDIFMLQFCSGVDENDVGAWAELVFAPIDASFSDDAPLLPSGFRIIPIDSSKDVSSPKCILDLTSVLEVGAAGNKSLADNSGSGSGKSVMKI